MNPDNPIANMIRREAYPDPTERTIVKINDKIDHRLK